MAAGAHLRSAPRADPPGGPAISGALRSDIQGLRALAVVAVILDHLIGWPSGGFAGVDVFFVVSGFLITGLLLRRIERDGRVPLLDFYRRRLKRILPAALLVLVVGTAAAYLLFSPARFAEVLGDAGWAALFAANWRFLATGTDYFQSAGPLSPFQHFWSLAVEEQFYLVWPWLLLAIVLLARRFMPRRPRRGMVAATGALTLASFAWAVGETAARPTVAYFSTASRAWELGVGALLALAVPALQRVPNVWRPRIGWAGLVVIGIALIVVTPSGGFPAPEALLPVAGAALVVAAGTGGESRRMWVLTNPVSVWLGDLSYSLYLWHFPVIVLLGALLPSGTAAYLACCVGLTVLLSVVSFTLVEDPIRRSRLLERRSGEQREGRRMRAGAGPSARAAWLGAAVAGCVLIGGVAMSVPASEARALQPLVPSRAPESTRVAAQPAPVTSTPGPHVPSPSAQQQMTRAIRTALAARAWPALTPDVASVGAAARVPEWTKDGCLQVGPRNLRHCTWGSGTAPHTAVVIGDSIALSWLPAIRGALEPAGYRVLALDTAQCPAARLAMTDWDSRGDFAARCLDHVAWEVREVRALRPDVVIGSSAPSTQWRLKDGASGAAAIAEWQRGQEDLLRILRPLAGQVVVLDPPPPGRSLQECKTRFSSPNDCAGPLPGYLEPFTAASRRAAVATHAADIRTAGWFCTGGRCPAFVGHTPVFADGQHLTGAYAKRLAPVLATALARSGVPLAGR